MRFQFSLRTLLLFVAVMALLSGLATYVPTWLATFTTIAKVDLGNGRTAVISSDGSADVVIGVYCTVVDARGRTLLSKHNIGDAGYSSEDRRRLLEFSAVSADDGEVVGIMENHNPDVIVALYDFTTNESWAHVRCAMPADAAAYAARWEQERLRKLEAAYPGRDFELGSWTELGVPR